MGSFKKSGFSDLHEDNTPIPSKLYAEVPAELLGQCVQAVVRAGYLISFGSNRSGNAYISIIQDDKKDKFVLEDAKALAKKLRGIIKTAQEMIAEEGEDE